MTRDGKQIFNDSLYFRKMQVSRILHEFADCVDNKRDIRSCDGLVDETSNQLSI